MSDGLSEGYRWAQESEARQQRIDAFFGLVADAVEMKTIDARALRDAFGHFDACRFHGQINEHRLRKTVGRRWTALQETLKAARRTEYEGFCRAAYAKLLALALEYGSPEACKRLQALSKFYRIALYVPNGKGRPPSIYGDLPGVLDTLAAYQANVTVTIIDEPERAVVGVQLGPKGKEIKDPERSRLRFLAVYDHDTTI